MVDGIPSAYGAEISSVGNGNSQRRFSNFPTLVFPVSNVGFAAFETLFTTNPSFAGHRWQQRKIPSGIPLASVHVPLVGEHMAAGYLEDVFFPAAFRVAEGVSVHSVVEIPAPKC